MKKPESTVRAILAVAVAVFSCCAVAAPSAVAKNSPPAAKKSLTAKKSEKAAPETVKPFSETDPASKPRPIDVNPRNLQKKQPAFIHTKR